MSEESYLIDTSAAALWRNPLARSRITRLVATGRAATCITLDLAAGYSGVDGNDVRLVRRMRKSDWRISPITEEIANQARELQIFMSEHMRMAPSAANLLTAAVGDWYSIPILHYHPDFMWFQAFTEQDYEWIVPPDESMLTPIAQMG